MFCLVDGHCSITDSSIEMAGKPVRTSKNEKPPAPQIEQVLACIDPSQGRRAIECPLKVFLGSVMFPQKIVRLTKHRICNGRIVRISGLLCSRFASKCDFETSSHIHKAVKIHGQTAEQT